MKPLATPKVLRPRPIAAGWALDAIIQCDEARPGFLRFALSSSAFRRQVIFLARQPPERKAEAESRFKAAEEAFSGVWRLRGF